MNNRIPCETRIMLYMGPMMHAHLITAYTKINLIWKPQITAWCCLLRLLHDIQ